MMEYHIDSDDKLIKGEWELDLIGKNYESGFRGLHFVEKPIELPGPQWNGEELSGKTVLVSADQGFGDTILFSRFLMSPWREKFKCEVIFDCQSELLPVLDIPNMVDRSHPEPIFDYCVPLSSLPHLLGIHNEADFVKKKQYINGNIKEKITPDEKLKIGLIWKGTNHTNIDLNLYDFESNLDVSGCNLYSLQYCGNQTIHEFTNKIAKTALTEIRWDLKRAKMKPEFMLGNKIEDFSDTVSYIEQMDIIISVDTVTAHLAGAMNKPVWIPLKWGHVYWPWYSLFYPSAVTFWQKKNESWFYVLEQLRNKINRYIS